MAVSNIEEPLKKEELEDQEVEQDQYLVFSIKGQEFGIQAMWVQEISRAFSATEVPSAPEYVEGILSLRGRLATIINFRKKLGFEEKENDEDTRTIIIEQEDFPVGLVVDSVSEVIKIDEQDVQKLPESLATPVSNNYITSVGLIGERIVILLDVATLVNKQITIETSQAQQVMKEAKALAEAAPRSFDDRPSPESERGSDRGAEREAKPGDVETKTGAAHSADATGESTAADEGARAVEAPPTLAAAEDEECIVCDENESDSDKSRKAA